jgi:hypothetical protein
MAKKLIPTLAYTRGEFLALAVLHVYTANATQTVISGFTETDQCWIVNSVLRADLHTRARLQWSKMTGRDFTWFPFSEDAVVRLYARYQKRTTDELASWERELKASIKTV